jgi:septin family protein
MKKVSQFCNIIPVIAKGDKYDFESLIKMKNDLLLENSRKYEIVFYDVYTAINVIINLT